MAIAKAAVDQARIPTLTQLEDASRVVKENIKASSGDSRREVSMEAEKLRSELAAKQKSLQDHTAAELRDRLAKDALSGEIDAEKAQATKLQSEIDDDNGQLLLVDADLRDLKRSYDSAVIARKELEAEYPVLAEPVPELPQNIQDWVAEFQGITPNPLVSRGIHETYFRAVSTIQNEGPKVAAAETERDVLVRDLERNRADLVRIKDGIKARIEKARALKAAIVVAQNAAADADNRAREIDVELGALSIQLMSVDQATAVITGYRQVLMSSLEALQVKANEIEAAVKALGDDRAIPGAGQVAKSYLDRVKAHITESEFLLKSLKSGDTAFVISRILDLVEAIGQDVDNVNAAQREKLTDDRFPSIKVAARLRAEAIGGQAHEGGPIPADELMIEDDVLKAMEAGLDEIADIATLTDQFNARIQDVVDEILKARTSARAAAAREALLLARLAVGNQIRDMRDAAAYTELDPQVRGGIVMEQAMLARDGAATVATATQLLGDALEKQYKPTVETWKKAMNIIGKSFPAGGAGYGHCKIHISFFRGNLSSAANEVLRVRSAVGAAVNVDTLMHNLFLRDDEHGRVHATLQTGGSKTPSVYYDDMTVANQTEVLHMGRGATDMGVPGAQKAAWIAGCKTALKQALVDHLRTQVRPLLQSFVDKHGRLK